MTEMDKERAAWNALVLARVKGKKAGDLPSPWEAHQAGWEAGRAYEREQIAAYLEWHARSCRPDTQMELRQMAKLIRDGYHTLSSVVDGWKSAETGEQAADRATTPLRGNL